MKESFQLFSPRFEKDWLYSARITNEIGYKNRKFRLAGLTVEDENTTYSFWLPQTVS